MAGAWLGYYQRTFAFYDGVARGERSSVAYAGARKERSCSGVRPSRLRTHRAKCDGLAKPARRPISAVVRRLNAGDCNIRSAQRTRASIKRAPKVLPLAASAR